MRLLDAALKGIALLDAISAALKADPDTAAAEATREVEREIERVTTEVKTAICDARIMSRGELDARLEHYESD